MTKLLVIDDEESARKVLKISLESDGYTVFTAEDGPSGLDILARENPSIVLTDIRMPLIWTCPLCLATAISFPLCVISISGTGHYTVTSCSVT